MDTDNLARELGVERLERLPRDVSPRQYFRGYKEGQRFVVMFYSDVNDDSIRELKEFIRIGEWLKGQGLKCPELLGQNEGRGYALFEDLGQTSFGKRIQQGKTDKKMLYSQAVDVLKVLYNARPPAGLLEFKQTRIYQNQRQIVDYYMPFKRGIRSEEGLLESYRSVWQEIESSIPPCSLGFVHGDYHLENLMYLEQESGIEQCALIDYQDAFLGPLPYDLVNLLEDARVDIPEDLRQKMIVRYCETMSGEEKDTFLKWYRVLGTQFHCRVIGLFIKLAAEQGRDEYLIHISRLQAYIRSAMQDPLLYPIRAWFEKQGLDFEPINDLDGNLVRKAFQDISF